MKWIIEHKYWGVALLGFSIHIILNMMYKNNMILNIQAYIDVSPVPIFFWIGAFGVFMIVLSKDVGYFKFVSVFGLVLVGYMFLFLIFTALPDFSKYSNDEYNLIIEVEDGAYDQYIRVYQKENILYSSYKGEIKVSFHYEYTYTIEDDLFIIEKCTDNGCQYDQIQLD